MQSNPLEAIQDVLGSEAPLSLCLVPVGLRQQRSATVVMLIHQPIVEERRPPRDGIRIGSIVPIVQAVASGDQQVLVTAFERQQRAPSVRHCVSVRGPAGAMRAAMRHRPEVAQPPALRWLG